MVPLEQFMRIVSASEASLVEACALLRRGGIVIHPTETCYGLACDLGNPEAVARLFRLKRRPEDQPVSGLFPSVEEAGKWVRWNVEATALARKHLPGPLTIILPLLPSTRLFPTPRGGRTLGVRVSAHPLAALLARQFGSPVSTTSANIHGRTNPYSPADVLAQWPAEDPSTADLLLLDAGTLPVAPPSTVVDLSGGNVREVRKGGLRV